jgi:hypothetical protein
MLDIIFGFENKLISWEGKLTSAILGTPETEIMRIKLQSQPG